MINKSSKSLNIFLIIILIAATAFWLFVTLAKYQENNTEQSSKDVFVTKLLDKYLYMTFLTQIYPDKIGNKTDFNNKIYLEASKILEEKVADDRDFAISLAVIFQELNNTKKYEEVLKTWLKNEPTLTEIIECLYGKKHRPQAETANVTLPLETENIIKNEFKGFFRDILLLKYYEATTRPKEYQTLLAQCKEKGLLFSVELVVLCSFFVLCLIIGSICILVFTFAPLKIKKEKLKFSPDWDWKEAWFAFLSWDFMHLFSGVILLIIIRAITIKFPIVPTIFANYIFINGIFLLGVMHFFKLQKNNNFKLIGLNPISPFKAVMVGFLGYASVIPFVVIANIIDSLFVKNNIVSNNPVFTIMRNPLSTFDVVLLFLLVGIIGPIFEEILFRGLLYTTARRYLRPVWSIILISFIFAFIHGDITAMLPIFGLSLVLTYVYEKTSSIIPSIIIHSMWNSITFITFYLLFS